MWVAALVLLTTGAQAQEVEFPDPDLRAGILAALEKAPEEAIRQSELATLTHLALESVQIADLRGLEFATRLVSLRLAGNALQSLQPLSSLPALTRLDVRDNQLTDLSPLAGLGLERLDIGGNRITDLGPLAALPALREVHLGGNPVRDFAPLVPLVRTGLLVYWRPDSPGGVRTVRVEVDEPESAVGTGFLLDAPGAAQATAEDLAAIVDRGYVEALVTDAALELALRTGQRVVVVGPLSAPLRGSRTRGVSPQAVPPEGPAAAFRPQPLRSALSQTLPLVETAGIRGFACYRTVDETYASIQALADTYSHLAEWIDLGDSWKKTQDSNDGDDIMVLKLTNTNVSGPKPALFITSALHAQEYTTAELTTRFAEQLVTEYGVDADATWLLDQHEVHLMLHANPDGRRRAEAGLSWRKNHNMNHCPSSVPGVDLNRNFDPGWYSGSPHPCFPTYRGSAPASEPETQAIVQHMQSLFSPDDTSGIYLDIHSPGSILITTRDSSDQGARTFARKLSFFNRYPPVPGAPGGHAINYAYSKLGLATVLFELGTSFFQDCASFKNAILPGNLAALRYALKIVRTPRITPAGPDAVSVTTGAESPSTAVAAGTTVTLSATFDDTRRYSDPHQAQALAGGAYYVDVPPWAEGAAAVAMAATDGTWDEKIETATAALDTTDWSEGRHLVFVRARDVGSNREDDSDDTWGAVSAAFVYIGTPAPPAPTLAATSGTLDSLDVTWTAPAAADSITSYDLRYIRSDADETEATNWTEISSAWTTGALAYTLSGLDEGRLYDVQVRAVSSDGSTLWSASTRQRVAGRAPTFPDENAAQERSMDEATTTASLPIGEPVSATDPTGEALTYSLVSSSADATRFRIDPTSGQLRTNSFATYDYETEPEPEYQVQVKAASPRGGSATVQVTITLLNVEEPGSLSLTPAQPRVGGRVAAALTDSDSPLQNQTWQWERWNANQGVWEPMSEVTGNHYTPVSADEGVQLRVTVTYEDSYGPGKTVQKEMRVAPPAVSVSAGRGVTEGTAARFTLTVSPPPASALVVTLSVEETGAFVADAALGQKTVTVPTSGRATYTVPTLSDTVAEVHGDVTVALHAGPGYDLGSPASASVRVYDNDRVGSGGGGGGGNGGGGNSGGGGSGSRPRDDYGNSAGQATRIAPGGRTAGQLHTRSDVDYFTLTVPHAGVLVVETSGSTDTRATVWQAGVELASADSGGSGRNLRLSVQVEAGPVVLAVRGNGRQTGHYTLRTALVTGSLENPAPAAFQSGLGVISGWVCEAEAVTIEIETAHGQVVELAAAYGTERADTAAICGDPATGFGLLFNWNLLGDGEHEVVALVDGIELARAAVTVTTLGAEFVRDVAGTCEAENFPSAGETVALTWQESSQNFVLASAQAPTGSSRAGVAGVGMLENPGPHSFQSGIGVISGWVCEAEAVTLEITPADGEVVELTAAYGTERADTVGACGDTDNGFGLLFNWNLLGAGEHEVVALADGEEVGRAVVRVTTLGAEFVRGIAGECVVADFPTDGETVTLEWQESQQNFVITGVD